jgi:DNA adenine methylase
VTFVVQDFVTARSAAQPGDVVYCDPPYVPLSATANFTSYSVLPFGADEQAKLATLAEELAA